MNRIVREHYPVEKLPEDLREGFSQGAAVAVTIEVETDRPQQTSRRLGVLEARALAQRATPIGDDAVERIRKLRDEWDI